MSAMSEFKVGAFVITSVALILGGVVILGSGAIFKETETIETSTMESVNGLQIGSPVKFRGVPIGEVTVISFADRFYPENPLGETQFDYGSPVVIRMKVRIDVFGPEQSELFTKDLERGVIQGLRAALLDLPLMMKSARDAADRLDKLVASDQVTRILANVDSAAGDLTPTLDQYRLLGAELTSFLESESYELRQLITALRQTSQNLEQLSERAKQDPSQLLFGQPPPKLAPGATAPSTPQ